MSSALAAGGPRLRVFGPHHAVAVLGPSAVAIGNPARIVATDGTPTLDGRGGDR